ncbi:hypothetical protein Dimus_026396, partial [Dionaea muscipula]
TITHRLPSRGVHATPPVNLQPSPSHTPPTLTIADAEKTNRKPPCSLGLLLVTAVVDCYSPVLVIINHRHQRGGGQRLQVLPSSLGCRGLTRGIRDTEKNRSRRTRQEFAIADTESQVSSS